MGNRDTSLLHRLRIDVHAAWLAARDRRTPWYARAFGLFITAYALSPLDLIPDFIPVLGLLDDALLIPLGLWLFTRMLPPGLFDECRAEAERVSQEPRSWVGALIIVCLWLVAAALLYRLLASAYN
ncbi:YkvA family protein [Sphingomonas sp.]|uniref:YkvA family protein n=1 Tax=Sphingomonas sp. TaxID=28214 RepID=UPI002FC66FC0